MAVQGGTSEPRSRADGTHQLAALAAEWWALNRGAASRAGDLARLPASAAIAPLTDRPRRRATEIGRRLAAAVGQLVGAWRLIRDEGDPATPGCYYALVLEGAEPEPVTLEPEVLAPAPPESPDAIPDTRGGRRRLARVLGETNCVRAGRAVQSLFRALDKLAEQRPELEILAGATLAAIKAHESASASMIRAFRLSSVGPAVTKKTRHPSAVVFRFENPPPPPPGTPAADGHDPLEDFGPPGAAIDPLEDVLAADSTYAPVPDFLNPPPPPSIAGALAILAAGEAQRQKDALPSDPFARLSDDERAALESLKRAADDEHGDLSPERIDAQTPAVRAAFKTWADAEIARLDAEEGVTDDEA